jgi:hypothetical protein
MPHFRGVSGSLRRWLVQFERLVQAAHGQFHVFFVDDHRGLDLRGGNHLDVDAFFAQGAEHLAGHAHMAAHADADNAHLADLGVARHFLCTQLRQHFFIEQLDRTRVVVAIDGEAEVGLAVLADVLDDHVDFNVGLGHGAQDLVGDAWLVGHAQHRNLGLVAVESDAGYDGLFHFFVFLKSDQRAGLGFFVDVDVPGREAGEHAHGHLVFACKLDRADLQHLAAQTGHFQHFLKAHRMQTTCLGHHARVGGVNAIHVGVDQAFGGFHGGCHGHGRGVRATAAQRGDVAFSVDALKAGDDDHLAGVQVGAHALVVDRLDARLGVAAVGADGDLPASVADRFHSFGLQRDGQQR